MHVVNYWKETQRKQPKILSTFSCSFVNLPGKHIKKLYDKPKKTNSAESME